MDSKELYLQSFKNIQTSKVSNFNNTNLCYSGCTSRQLSISQLPKIVLSNQEIIDKEISQKKRSEFFTQYKKLGVQKQIAQTKLSEKGKGHLMVICKDKSNAPSRAGSFLNKSINNLKNCSANSPLPCGSPIPGKSTKSSLAKLMSPTVPRVGDVVNCSNEAMFITNIVDGLNETNKDVPSLDTKEEMLTPIFSPIPKRKPKSKGPGPLPKDSSVPRYAHAEVSVLSPRSHYMDACLRSRIHPRPALISKLNFDKINLQHQIMGDVMGIIVAECMLKMDHVEYVDLCDNNLSDRGLTPLIASCAQFKHLSYLNISHNMLGPGAAYSLLEFLDTQECPLAELVMSSCDVDDYECLCFVASLVKESKFTKLSKIDLSKNKLGRSELQSEQGKTSGEAVAQWLCRPDCILETLNLSWNMYRSYSGVSIANSLQLNRSLIYLDLSYNALGREGGLALGSSIIDNKTLKTLLIGHNNIDSMAAFTICVGIMENTSLNMVSLDGNPIGERGAKALMMIPLVCAGRVHVSSKQCNITMKDPTCWFNFDELPGKYALRLDLPYERAVCLMLLRLIAFDHSCIFTNIEFDRSGVVYEKLHGLVKNFGYGQLQKSHSVAINGVYYHGNKELKLDLNANTKKIVLISALLNREDSMDERQLMVANNMRMIVESTRNTLSAQGLFETVDLDHNGGIDISELRLMMRNIGINLTELRLREIMSLYDTEGSGVMQMDDFISYLTQCQEDLSRHLNDLLHLPIMVKMTAANRPPPLYTGCNDTNIDVNALLSRSNSSIAPSDRYIPPTSGCMVMDVLDEFVMKDIHHTIASCDREYVSNIAQNSPDPELLESMILTLTKIRVEDAVEIAKEALNRRDRSSTGILMRLLRHMNTEEDARLLISQVIGSDNRIEMNKLKREMGHSLKPTLGMLNGYYILDLAVNLDKTTLMTLYEFSQTSNHKQALKSPIGFGLVGDTSQKGNWSSFRNEMLNKKPLIINDAFIRDLPNHGLLEFDFSGEVKPDAHAIIMRDAAFVQSLVKLHILDDDLSSNALGELRLDREACNNCLKGDGMVLYERPIREAEEICHYRALFYDNLNKRSDFMHKSLKLEQFNGEDGKSTGLIAPGRDASIVVAASLDAGSGRSTFMRRNSSKTGVSLDESINSNAPLSRNSSNSSSSSKSNPSRRRPSLDELKLPSVSVARTGRTIIPVTKAKQRASSAVTKRVTRYAKNVKEADDSTTISSTNAVPGAVLETRKPLESSSLALELALPPPARQFSRDFSNIDAIGQDTLMVSTPCRETTTEQNPNDILISRCDSERESLYSTAACTPKGQSYYGVKKELTNSASVEYLKEINALDNMTGHGKMKRLVDVIEETYGCYKWIRARQLALMLRSISRMEYGNIERSGYFGNYRVEVVVMLFGHLVDVHNFDLIERELTPYESACVSARIGLLNYYNPMRPEGSYSLDIKKWDERQVCKILVLLATHESGENWINKKFKWTIDSIPVPGWELTQNWVTDKGMPRRGILELTYVSKLNCTSIKFRKSMLFNTKLLETDFIPEKKINTVLHENIKMSHYVGCIQLKLEIELWKIYLIHDMHSPDAVDVQAIEVSRRKHKIKKIKNE